MSAKNIINGSRITSGGVDAGAGGAFEHLTITEQFADNNDGVETFTLELFKQGNLVTLCFPQVLIDMQEVANWRRAAVIPAGWRPQHYVVTTFPACTNINSTLGLYQYDTDTLAIAEVGPAGNIILHRQPPPATGVWNRPDDTSRVGWQAWSVSWFTE